MKRLLTVIFALLCLFQVSMGQTIKSIHINSDIKNQSWSLNINKIDSITYDEDSLIQKIHVGDNHFDASLADINSVSFSNEDAINVVSSKDFIANTNSYLFSNGIVLIEKDDSLKNKIILVDSVDCSQNKIIEDNSFVIYCDSVYHPILAKNSQFIFYFEYDESGKLKEVHATDLNGNEVHPHKSQKQIQRVSTDGWEEGMDDLKAVLDMYGTMDAIYNPNPKNLGTMVASWLSGLLPKGIPQDVASLIIGAFDHSKLGLLGNLLSCEQLIRHIGENIAKKLIGDCTPYIQSVVKKGKKSAVVKIQIAGVSTTSQYQPYYVVKYWQETDGEKNNVTYSTVPKEATNGTHDVLVDNLKGGHYGFQVLLFPDLFIGNDNKINLCNFRSNIAHLDIAPLYLKTIEQGYTSYADDYVTVSMKAVVDYTSEQDKKILDYYDNYGIYVYFDNHVSQNENFYSVKENGNTEFYITLDIPKEDFSCDYSKFIATCADKIVFKTYTIDGWGIKNFYDEQKPQIVYDEKPNVTFTSVQVFSPNAYPHYNEDGEYIYTRYSTPFQYNFNVEGAFWINYVQSYCYGGNWTDIEGPVQIVNDGIYENPTSMGYDDSSDMNFSIAYHVYLNNGSEIKSTNSVIMGGTPTQPTGCIGGSPNYYKIKTATQNRTPTKHAEGFYCLRK